MPRSKRAKKISLTKTKKKGNDAKQKLITDIRESLDKYSHIFTFSLKNSRNSLLKDVRQEWKDSRFFFAKNKLMALALGKAKSDESKENLHLVSRQLKGQTGLLFTNREITDVLRFFEDYSQPEFARSGNIASHTVYVEEGPLRIFQHNMEPTLRQLGLPTKLEKGIITLRDEFVICKRNDVLTPEKARILKLFDYRMVDFEVFVDGYWTDGKYTKVKKDGATKGEKHVKYKVRLRQRDRLPGQNDVTDADLGFEAVEEEDNEPVKKAAGQKRRREEEEEDEEEEEEMEHESDDENNESDNEEADVDDT